jgi:hypothetical protein
LRDVRRWDYRIVDRDRDECVTCHLARANSGLLHRHSCRQRRSDFGHDPECPTGVPRRDNGNALDGRFRAVSSRWLGGRCGDRCGWWYMDTPAGWLVAFLVMAAGGLMGPMVLWWSMRTEASKARP